MWKKSGGGRIEERLLEALAEMGSNDAELFFAWAQSEVPGSSVRRAAANARHLLLEKAAAALQVPIATLQVTDGTISDGTDSTANAM